MFLFICEGDIIFKKGFYFMNISLDWYKIFCEVAKKKNITVAAENLCISQPAVSQTIKQLEESLNAELFLRTKKGVTLTKEGEVLYSYVL